MDKRRFIKYQIIETGEIRKIYRDENAAVYDLAVDLYGDKKLPAVNVLRNIKFLNFGIDND